MQFEWINLAQSKQETVEKRAYAVPGFTLFILLDKKVSLEKKLEAIRKAMFWRFLKELRSA